MGRATLIQASKQDGQASVANTTQYMPLGGRSGLLTTEAHAQILFREAGTIDRLFVRLTANSVAATSTVRTRKNAANGNQSVSIGSSATGAFEDQINSDTIAAGDKLCYQSVPGAATGTYTFTLASVNYNATGDDAVTRCCVSNNVTYATASTTNFMQIIGELGSNTTEANGKTRIRKAGTFKSLLANITSNARTTTTTVRVRKNGADSSLVVSIGSTATGFLEDTTNSFTVVNGDDINFSHATGTGTQNQVVSSLVVSYVSTVANGEWGLCAATRSAGMTISANQTNYFNISGLANAGNTTESQVQKTLRRDWSFVQLTVLVTANSVSAASTLMLRVNTAVSALSASITASTTGVFVDSTNTVDLASGDVVDYRLVTGATGTSMSIRQMAMASLGAVSAAQITRALPTETVSISEGLTRMTAKTRTRSETVTISENRTRLAAKNRALSTQTVIISENITRTKGKPRAPATQTVTVSESIARQTAKIRTRSETVTVGESQTRLAMKSRPLQTETVTVTGGVANRVKGAIKNLPQTVAISENLARLTNKSRAVPAQTVTISEQRARQAAKARTLSTETVTVGGGTVQKLKGSVRTLATQTITIGESIARQTNKTRAIIQTIVISDSASRLAAKMRALASQTVVIADSLARVVEHEAGGVVRSLTESVGVSDSLTRLKSANRALEETTPTSENVGRVKGISRQLGDSVTIGETLNRIKQATRSLTETIETSEAVQRMAAKIRTFIETVTTSDAVQQFKETPAQHIVRALTETVNVSDLLNRMVAKARSIVETVPITESLQGAKNDEPFGVFVPGGGTSGTGADTGYTTTKKSVAAIVVIKLPQLMVTAKSITIPKLVNIRVLPRPRVVQRSPVIVKYVERVVEKQAATLPTREVQAMKPFTAQIVSPHLKVSSIITKLPEVRVTAHHLTTQKEIRDRKRKLLKIIGLGYLLDKLD